MNTSIDVRIQRVAAPMKNRLLMSSQWFSVIDAHFWVIDCSSSRLCGPRCPCDASPSRRSAIVLMPFRCRSDVTLTSFLMPFWCPSDAILMPFWCHSERYVFFSRRNELVLLRTIDFEASNVLSVLADCWIGLFREWSFFRARSRPFVRMTALCKNMVLCSLFGVDRRLEPLLTVVTIETYENLALFEKKRYES